MGWKRILCAIGHHRPARQYVRYDGTNYTGECRRCQADIVRVSRKKWRAVQKLRITFSGG
jgi:hypothetical protein